MVLRPVAVLTTAVLAVITACAAAPPPAAAQPGLVWAPCGDGAVECATVPVPVDHAEPDGERIGIAIARLPAEAPATRRGTLVLHTGGPAPSLPTLLDPRRRGDVTELTRWFDVVTFDSRGYGASSRLCDAALAPPVTILDAPDAFDAHLDRQNAYAASCRAGHPALAEHVSAEDTAHDIDAIRVALGEERIAFYGNSYGTVFGQEYAEHHGHRLSRLYLDSVADHTTPPLTGDVDNAVARDGLLTRFAQRCAADPACALHGEDALAVWDGVVARAPLPGGDGPPLGATEIRLGSPVLAELDPLGHAAALAAAHHGDGSALAAFLRRGPIRPGDAGQLTNCTDFPRPGGYAERVAARRLVAEHAPRTGGAPTLEDWRCAGWPLPATNAPAPLDAPDAPPALVVNATLDPATHLAGARRVAEQIEGSAVLPVEGFAHALYLAQPGNRCVRDAVHGYLIDGHLPAPGTTCASTAVPGFGP